MNGLQGNKVVPYLQLQQYKKVLDEHYETLT